MQSKYNTGKPIDIKTLTAKERKKAFHEWAEGSKQLERLLNQGYNKGFLSHACCAGDTGTPYISYNLNDEYSRKMAMAIAKKLIDSKYNCEITMYDNFDLNDAYPEVYSDRGITCLIVDTLLENREAVFELMCDTIKHAKLKSIQLPLCAEQKLEKKFDIKKEKQATLASDLSTKVYDDQESMNNQIVENKEQPKKDSVKDVQGWPEWSEW